MKITVNQLRRIINEEVTRVVRERDLKEGFFDAFKSKKGIDKKKVWNDTNQIFSKYDLMAGETDELIEIGIQNAKSEDEYYEKILPLFKKAAQITKNAMPDTGYNPLKNQDKLSRAFTGLLLYVLENMGLEGVRAPDGVVSREWWKEATQNVNRMI